MLLELNINILNIRNAENKEVKTAHKIMNFLLPILILYKKIVYQKVKKKTNKQPSKLNRKPKVSCNIIIHTRKTENMRILNQNQLDKLG